MNGISTLQYVKIGVLCTELSLLTSEAFLTDCFRNILWIGVSKACVWRGPRSRMRLTIVVAVPVAVAPCNCQRLGEQSTWGKRWSSWGYGGSSCPRSL